MPDFISLTCPTCGGKLQITPDIERFACGYCGNEHIVRRGGGIISLIPIGEDIKGIKTGVDKTAAELAMLRLEKEICKLNQKNQEIRQDIQQKYNTKGTDYPLFFDTLMNDLIQRKDGIHIPDFMQNKMTQTYKDRWLALTVDDIDYLIKTAIPFHMQHGGGMLYMEILNDLRVFRQSLLTTIIEIPQKEAEMAKLKQLVSN